jgi:hypothetical protein
LVLCHRDLISAQVSRSDTLECKLWVKDFNLPSDRFNAQTSRLLALHSRHHKETGMHRILVLWDRATVVVRLDTMPISVPGSRQIKLQLQAQIRTSTAMLTTVQPPSKAESSSCSCEPYDSGRCSSSPKRYHWYDHCQ